MNARTFYTNYYPAAMVSQAKTKVPYQVTLVQAALESAWGTAAPGNNYFGIKDDGVLNGNEQLLLTWEYINNPDKKFPVVVSVTQVGKKMWKYRVKDWFRKYNSPEECFIAHGELLATHSRYAEAMKHTDDPYRFAAEIHKAGYATDPDYTKKLISMLDTLKTIIPQ